MAEPVVSSLTALRASGRGVLALLTGVVMLAGCAAGPNYAPPQPEVPAGFVHTDGPFRDVSHTEPAFWKRFDDPLLGVLVDDALAHNHDLQSTLANYQQALALLRHSRLDYLPRITADAQASSQRSSADHGVVPAGSDRRSNNRQVGASAFWEPDLFGRLRHATEGREALLQAAEADHAAMQVEVIAELVHSYVRLRGLQAQLEVARENAGNQEETLSLAQARLDAGGGTEFDRARARTQLESTRARIPAVEARIAFHMHRVAVLTGRPPGSLLENLAGPGGFAVLPDSLPVGSPADLLRRRPDIIAAERRLAAATARIGVATADLFPRVTLEGFIGSQAGNTDQLFTSGSATRLIALGVDWSFLDSGRVRARIAAADAEAESHLANYRQTVLHALEETENAMVSYLRVQDETQHLARAADAGAEAARLARLRYEGGAVDFLHVLDAERARLETEDQLADARTRGGLALVAVYRALAGGWGMAPELATNPQHDPQG